MSRVQRSPHREQNQGGSESDAELPRHEVPLVFSSLVRLAHRLRATRLPHELTVQRLSMLGAIRAHQPISMSDLMARASMSQTATSRCVATLEDQGLVRRHADSDDGRAVILSTTAKGDRAFNKALEECAKCIVEICSDLSDAERSALIGTLTRSVDAAVTPGD